jgi:hypothetical protein
MKPQDLVFIVVFVCIGLSRRPRLFVWTGLGCLILAIPLFAKWVFFTAERLTWYAAAFFLTYTLYLFVKIPRVPYNRKKGEK